MSSQFHIVAVLLLISTLFTFVASIIAWHRSLPGSFPLCLLLLAMTVWAGFYSLHWLPIPPNIKVLLPNITYIGVIAVPTLFLVFALSYTRPDAAHSRRLIFALCVEPVVTVMLVWTNHYHHLVFKSINLLGGNNLEWVQIIHGPWYVFNMFYSYAVILTGVILLLHGMLRSSPLLKNQYRMILFAALIPWVLNIYCEYTTQVKLFDFTPIAFGLSGILFAYSIVRYRFMDIIPVARSRIIESMSDGVLVIDAQNRIVDINPAMGTLLNSEISSFLGKSASEVLGGWMDETEGLMSGVETRIELSLPNAPSRYLDLRVTPLYDHYKRLNGRLMVFRDVTDSKQVEKKLRHANDRLQSQLIAIGTLQSELRSQAIRDPLTNLFNRRYLDETLDRELARAAREAYPVCVIMMDIDHFKKMNDTYGHEAGDLVLKEMANTLSMYNRRGDFACRFGGEEFVVVMLNIALETAYHRAVDLRQALNALTIPYGAHNLTITISMGIASYPSNGDCRESILRAADRAMYAAKDAGRDHILTYDVLQAQHEMLSD